MNEENFSQAKLISRPPDYFKILRETTPEEWSLVAEEVGAQMRGMLSI